MECNTTMTLSQTSEIDSNSIYTYKHRPNKKNKQIKKH